MKAYVAVLSRELKRKKMIWLAALVAGIIPFLIAAINRGGGFGFGEARDASAYAITIGIGITLALIMGSTMIGRDISEDRLGFDFARPIGGLAIWWGRFSATVIMVLGASFVAILPATLTGGGLFRLTGLENPAFAFNAGVSFYLPAFYTLLLFGFLLVGLVAGAHAAGTIVRAHSVWVFLDLAGFILFFIFSYLAVKNFDPFGWTYAGRMIQIISYLVLAAIGIIALVMAGAFQVCLGRTDRKAGHKALSITLWSVCLFGALSLLSYSHWYTNVSIHDFANVDNGYAAPEGDWMFVSGYFHHRNPDYHPGFLFNISTGQSLRITKSGNIRYPVFSTDGKRSVWVDHRGQGCLKTVEFGTSVPVVRQTTLPVPYGYGNVALSPSGKRCAMVSEGNIVVYDLATEKQLFSARVGRTPGADENMRNEIKFMGESSVRLITTETMIESGKGILKIYSIDLKDKTIVKTGEVRDLDGQLYVRYSPNGDTFILSQWGQGDYTTTLRNSETGSLIASFSSGPKRTSGAFLKNGQFAIISRKGQRNEAENTLKVFSDTGEQLKSIELERGSIYWLSGEPQEGRLFMTSWLWKDKDKRIEERSMLQVTLDSGEVHKLALGTVPLSTFWWYSNTRTLPYGMAACLVTLKDGSLGRINPDTGKTTVLIQGSLKNTR